MTSFWLAAVAFGAIALAFLLVPLWRFRRSSGRWPAAALVASIATIPAAVGMYLVVSNYDPSGSAGASDEERAMVAQLAAKMVENPDDVEGWRLLARSYMVLGEYGLGRQAYIEAWNRTPMPDNELKLALAEALILTERATLSGEGGQLVEEVLQAEPRNQRALWYGGLVAMERGREDLARSRWQRFLEYDPPEEIASTVRRLIAQLPPEASSDTEPADPGFSLELAVTVAEDLPVEALGPQAALFIFARAPGERAPVAVIRQPVSALPGTFTLSDRDAMIAGRSLAGFEELALVARISLSGQPTEQPGDLYAEGRFERGDPPRLALVIDKVVP